MHRGILKSIGSLQLTILTICFLYVSANAKEYEGFSIDKIEPPNWWSGMQNDTLELMIYGKNLNGVEAGCKNAQLKLERVVWAESHQYLFLRFILDKQIKPGQYPLTIHKEKEYKTIHYPILKRENTPLRNQGFDSQDIIYLITPDRFVNGDKDNDTIKNFGDTLDRTDKLARHGGDIQGIIYRLDYLKKLGITAIWINPLLENKTFISYHGYATTDFYKIDPRFGSNRLYKQLVKEAHKRNIKIIMDHVSNHMSIDHRWMKNLPFSNWINGTIEKHLDAVHEKSILADHYNKQEKIKMSKGWFADYMPDLNQENKILARYLKQNTIWWMEYSGLDGIREDTYPYVNQQFIADWALAILKQYPNANIVGEVWDGTPSVLGWYQENSHIPKKINSHLPIVTDFALTYAFGDFLTKKKGAEAFYNTLKQDFVYHNPYHLLTFIDNHDILRAAYLSNGINESLKSAYTLLLTLRGIPQIYYGSEYGIKGGRDHGEIREDFRGGFSKETGAFMKEGRSAEENALFNHIAKLISIRNNSAALKKGKFEHFPVIDNLYYYIRYFEDEKYLIILNGNDKTVQADIQYAMPNDTEKMIFFEEISGKKITKHHIKISGRASVVLKIIK
jgi:glycosidase